MSRKIIFMIIAASVLLGLISVMSPGILFCIFLTSSLLYVISKSAFPKDKRYILTIVIISLVLRLIALFGLQVYCAARGSVDILDGQDNIARGFNVADYVTGRSEYRIYFGQYNTHGQTFFNGLFFALFGKDIIGLKYVNILFLLLTGYLTYDLTRRIYSSSAGKIAMSIVLFWPTSFIWSITALKESHIILASILMLWGIGLATSLKNLKKRLFLLILTLIFILYVIVTRPRSMLPLILVYCILMSVYFIFMWFVINSRHKEIRAIIFTIILLLAIFLLKDKLYSIARHQYSVIIGYNIGFLNSGGFNYNLIGDINSNFYTTAFFLKHLLFGWYHFLLEPLPWHLLSLSLLILYPVMVFWYLMLCASIVGIAKIYKNGQLTQLMSMLIFAILYVTVFSMSVANIGTAVRYRDTIMPIVAILASCGILNKPEFKK